VKVASKEEASPEKRHLSVRRRAAIEDGVDGTEVYASSFGEVFSLP